MKEVKDCISIIVPVYNGALFIEKAYNNIIDQQLTNFELIFIDNNSTDASVAKISKIRHKDSSVSFYKETKQGAAAARNKGIAMAKGEFIHFFDVDDQLFEGALVALKKVLDMKPEICSVFGKTIKNTKENFSFESPKNNSNKITEFKKPNLGLLWLKNKNKLPGTPCFLHRRAVFDKINGFQEDLLIGEDAFFHVRLGNELKLAYIDRDIVAYFRHPNSTVSQQNRKVADKVFTYWQQNIKAYLPYCNSTKVTKEFKIEVHKQVFGSVGKMIVLTRGLKTRFMLKKKCENEIKPVKIPFVFNIFIYVLIFTGSFKLYKFYFFYILEPYFKIIH